MADEFDAISEHLAREVSRLYMGLTQVCAMLPIPVELPTPPGGLRAREASDAVRRVAELAEDQPMPEDHQAELFAACVYWLGAIDLLGLYMNYPEIDRSHSVAANLISMDTPLSDLFEWLESQE